jgi:3-oxoisoapionate decarboxylase
MKKMRTNYQNTFPRRGLLAITAAVTATALTGGQILGADVAAPAAPAAPATPAAPIRNRGIKLGFDNFAVRAMKWKAPALIDYAAQLKTDSLFITDLMAFESFDEPYLNDLRKKAAEVGVQIVLGSWSICPTSKSFKNTWGTAVEHGALTMRMAKALGSPVARFILGTAADRRTPGGIQARITDTVAVCKQLKPYYENLGVKIAIENHAGDMQSAELVELIETAGKDFVGANIDTGNGMWTLENPMTTLNNLAPYVLTTSLRDTMVWETDNGAMVQWVAMGDGVVDHTTFFDAFEKKCPGVAVHIETIGGFNKEIKYLAAGFFDQYPKQTAADFAAWLRLVRKGKALEAGMGNFANDQEFQKDQIERSISYCQNVLGLGPKA